MTFKVGVNLWQAVHWAEAGATGDRPRLLRELDRLQEIGIDHVRILATSQGIEIANALLSNRTFPASEIAPGVHREQSVEALEFVFQELEKRSLKAIVVLNNFWHWSGGFSQYLLWTKNPAYDAKVAAGFGASATSTEMFPLFRLAAKFFDDDEAQEMYFASATKILARFAHWHPKVVWSWQLANEPTPLGNPESFLRWIDKSLQRFRAVVPDHNFSLGGVGTGPVPYVASYAPLERIYARGNFSLMTVHMWPENWGWFSPARFPKLSFWMTKRLSRAYLRLHAKKAKALGIPMLLEEVGLARDGRRFDRASTTRYRDEFFRFVIDELKTLARDHPVEGITIWAWGGEGEPDKTWVGDPPHEPQGWYSVFDGDVSTVEVLREAMFFQ